MSIYVSGMDAPSCCAECPIRSKPELIMTDRVGLYEFISYCRRAPEDVEDPYRSIVWQADHKEAWCPISDVPPHGRLGDLDELKKKAYPFPCAIGTEYAVPIRAINDAPTIIPADKEGET